jgi:membrane protein implicated in regulation of membrane protease activity
MSKFLIIVGGIVVALVLIAVPVVFFIWVPPDAVQKLFYMSGILTGFFACGLVITTLALVVAILLLIRVLTNLTDSKVGPLLDKINETADSAKGTIAYVGEGVTSPLVKLAAIFAGLRAAIMALFRGGRSS